MTDRRSLQGKRLLMLGSTPNIVDMVKTAQQMGVYVIVTDNKPLANAPAKLVADEYADVSLADIDAVTALIREKRIDGVLTGFSDSYLKYYLEICERNGLPCYGDAKTFGIATDKKLFKQACEAAGVGTIPGVYAAEFDTVKQFAAKNGYPLMLKPADNSGSRGVIKCEGADTLRAAYDYAESFSAKHLVICERFMDCDGISISYQLIDGMAYLSSTCDRSNYFSAEGNSAITGDLIYPSEYTDRYIREADGPVKRMLAENGFRHGMVSLQSFVDDKGFYMCEMCYRPSGGHHYFVIKDQNGIDSLELLIEFAVTGSVAAYDPACETPKFHDVCAMSHIVGQPHAKIAKVSGMEALASIPEILRVTQSLREGDVVGKAGTTAQVLYTIWFKAATPEQLEKVYHQFTQQISYQDEAGHSLVIDRGFLECKRSLL